MLFVPGASATEILQAAAAIRQTEQKQASALRAGTTLRQQLRFRDYLTHRAADPEYTFRQHVRALGGAIEA